VDEDRKKCVFDNCTRFLVDDCLQHDFEGFFFLKVFFFNIILFLLGCRRMVSLNGTSDLCRFTSEADTGVRPSNKTEAMRDSIIGGTVVGVTGTGAATQIGVWVWEERWWVSILMGGWMIGGTVVGVTKKQKL
jgi:hypothetical protein